MGAVKKVMVSQREVCRTAPRNPHRVQRVQNKGENSSVQQRLEGGRFACLESIEVKFDFGGAEQVRQDGGTCELDAVLESEERKRACWFERLS